MLTGSSALQNATRQQIASPSITATLRMNKIGVSRAFNYNVARGTAILFNDNYVVFNQRDQSLLSFNADNLNAGTSVRVTGATGYFKGKFYNTGQTLLFYYMDIIGLTLRFYRLESNNGTTWGNSTNIFNLFGVGYDLAPTGNSRFYLLMNAGSINNDNAVGTVYAVNKLGVGWGETQANTRFHEIYTVIAEDHLINADNVGDYDVVLLARNGLSNSHGFAGVRGMITDGTQTFGEFDLIDSDTSTFRMRPSNLSKGSSLYYFGGVIEQWQFVESGGVSINNVIQHTAFLAESPDLQRWSNFRYISLHPTLFDDNANLPYLSLAGGSHAINPLTLFTGYETEAGASNAWIIRVLEGASTLDVSSDLINYSNQNNQRVSLTLANLK